MFEKVNPAHPDKIADRIAGAIVDLAYSKQKNPKIAIEVMIGHGFCHVIIETDADLGWQEISNIIVRIAGDGIVPDIMIVPQDSRLADNQAHGIKCGDNGIFKGMPTTKEQRELTEIAQKLYSKYKSDGKYLIADGELTICQSNCRTETLQENYPYAEVNPLGDWIGGTDVDTGCTNRKLGSDLGDAVTGGGLHGKDLSKADVTATICAHLIAKSSGQPVELYCSIGDEYVSGKTGDKKIAALPYSDMVRTAKRYIKDIGGFEKLAEWGLIR